MDLTVRIYALTWRFPAEERYGLISQMRRVASSIPANIAEGRARQTTGKFLQSPGIARVSLAALETFLILSTKLEMTTPENAERLRRDQQKAQRADPITIHSPLTTIHYSLPRLPVGPRRSPEGLFPGRNEVNGNG